MQLADRLLRVATPETDTIEQVAVFEDGGDVLMMGLGFVGSYLIENHDNELREVARFDRFYEALEQLGSAHHATLELTREKLGALAMLDELRGFFAMGELANARRLGASCEQALRDAFPVEPHGARRLIVREPAMLVRSSEQVLATFVHDAATGLGQLRQLLLAAADLAGGPREPHEVRDDSVRLTAFATRATTLETIVIACPFIHPAMWPAVAERLQTSVAVARRRLCGSGQPSGDHDEPGLFGPRQHADVLAGLFDHSLAVVPESARPALRIPARTRFAPESVITDPLTRAYEKLEAHNHRFRRLSELNAPDIILDNEAMLLQRMVEGVADAALRPLDVATLDGWPGSGPPRATVRLWSPRELEDQGDFARPTVLWLTDDRIAVAREGVASIISISQHGVVRAIGLGGAELQACDDAGRFVLTTANSIDVDSKGRVYGVGCFDSETGCWLEELPDHIPAVAFGGDQPEDGFLADHRNDRQFTCECDRPAALAWSRGNRDVWLTGDYGGIYFYGIRSTKTCLEDVSARSLEARCIAAPGLLADGSIVDEVVELDSEEGMYVSAPCAFANIAGDYRILTPSLHVADLDRTHFQLGFAIRAASFSPDAKRLLVATNEQLVVIDIAARAITWRYALA